MRLKLGEIAKLLGTTCSDPEIAVTGIAVDSRQVKPGDLFCAIIGANVDGHSYLEDAAAKGAVAALVTKQALAFLPAIEVESIDVALAKIATHIRGQFTGKVIAITGSVGKTTVKEMIAAALSAHAAVLKSEGNQNTEYGLPITMMRLQPEHKFMVLEMGMRGPGQIAQLCNFAKPDVGVITRIGTAHIGELGSQEAIANAKSELLESLPQTGAAVIPNDDRFSSFMRSKTRARVLTFGEVGADVSITCASSDYEHQTTKVTVSTKLGTFDFSLPVLGSKQASNAAAALAVVEALGLDVEPSARALEQAHLPPNRLQVMKLGGTVIVDVYNSSPESCQQALHLLREYPAEGERIAILGDMLELGSFSEAFHRQIGAEVARLGIDRLAVIGRDSHWIRDEAIAQGYEGRVDSLGTVEHAAKLISELAPDDVLLIKASRGLALEKAVEIARSAYA